LLDGHQLEEIWPKIQEKYGADILTINADNGMENSSSRTQFIASPAAI
jgi:hypothetical protein